MYTLYIDMVLVAVGLVHTVVSISACGAEHPGSISGLDSGNTINYVTLLHLWHEWEEQYQCMVWCAKNLSGWWLGK